MISRLSQVQSCRDNQFNPRLAQSGSAHALGAWGRTFKSCISDHTTLAQFGRVSRYEREGRRFKSFMSCQVLHVPLAQLVERWSPKPEVGSSILSRFARWVVVKLVITCDFDSHIYGSSPYAPAIAELTQLVECLPSKQNVVGSSPSFRSIYFYWSFIMNALLSIWPTLGLLLAYSWSRLRNFKWLQQDSIPYQKKVRDVIIGKIKPFQK